MLWNMIIEAQNEEQLTASITVEAPNWYSALCAGLTKHHIDGAVLSNLSCHVQKDKSVVVSDYISKRSFRLRPLSSLGSEESEASGDENEKIIELYPKEMKKSDISESAAPEEAAPTLVSHHVFFSRDECPSDGSGIFYRERLIAVEPGISKEAASHLAHHYFEVLKTETVQQQGKLFISVHIYDHSFTERSERPAAAALTWREWLPAKPKILYPLSGDEGITFSMLPPPAPLFFISNQAAEALSADTEVVAEKSSSLESQRVERSRFGVDERMIAAFEGMQDIYGIHNHDEAAAFVLSLARDLVRCEEGNCMLVSPKQYELYIAAAEGPSAEAYKGKSLSSTRGIIGFALKNSTVVIVSDPTGDSRFDIVSDERKGFYPKNILAAPMQYEGHVVGVIELVNSAQQQGFREEDANVLSYVATSFAEYAVVSLPSRQEDFAAAEPSVKKT